MRDAVGALLYDLGGVLIEINFDWILERWAQLGGVAFADLKARFSHCEAYQRYERSEIGLEEYFAALRRDLGIDLSDAQFVDGWQRVFGREHAEVVGLIRRLAGRIPQYAFSNTNPKHLEYWSRRYAEALRPLRRVFTSCEIGHRKPDPEAFLHVAREIGLPPGRILFFDDTPANVDGARAVGMPAVLVRSPEDVLRGVREMVSET